MKGMLVVVCILLQVLSCFSAPILVGPTRTYKKPSEAVSQFTRGFEMIIDDGHYYDTFSVPTKMDGFTIRSASGNAYACTIDGQGGYPSHPLAARKGVLYTQSAGTVRGIQFMGGGGNDGSADGEAGVYAEWFTTPSNLLLVDCAFDKNENGIFTPSFSIANGENVSVTVQNSIFSKESPNGFLTGGQCHNVYAQAAAYISINNIYLPSTYGHNIKSRSKVTTVKDAFNRNTGGRCLDIPSGGQLTVEGGIYTSSNPDESSGNVFSYAIENKNSGVYTPSISGMTITAVRSSGQYFTNGASEITINFASTTQQWANAATSFLTNGPGAITGLVSRPPSGYTYVSIPQPTFPSWATSGTSSATVATTAASSSSATTGASSSSAATTTSKSATSGTTKAATTTPGTSSSSSSSSSPSSSSSSASSTASASSSSTRTSSTTSTPSPSATTSTPSPSTTSTPSASSSTRTSTSAPSTTRTSSSSPSSSSTTQLTSATGATSAQPAGTSSAPPATTDAGASSASFVSASFLLVACVAVAYLL